MKKILLRKFMNWLFVLPNYITIILVNVFTLFSRTRSVKFGKCNKTNFFFVKDNYSERYFSQFERGIFLYYRGTKERGKILFNKYCLDKIKFKKSDVVIDCGANQGDLYLGLSEHILPQNYYAIEPSPAEFKCLEQSLCSGENLFNLALAEKNGFMDFYVSSAGADSSLIIPFTYDKKIKIKAINLETMFNNQKIKNCKLLKLEAEGYEPEILYGAKNILNRCEYITVAGGPERGVKKEKTLHIVANFLINNQFEMIDININSYRALFRNLNHKK